MAEVEEGSLIADPIGARLKAAREAQGMSLDDVAAKTRVPIRHLQHMERGEWDALPAPTYSVGFARAYANAVGLNGTEIGTELRAQLGSGGQSSAPAQYEPADPARVPPRALAIAACIIAILLAGAYILWRNGAVDDSAVDEGQITGVEASAPPAAAPPSTPPVQPAAQPSATGGPVVLTAANDVWLRVYDGKGGPKLYEGTLKAGQSFTVPATAQHPLILTGRPNALNVKVGATAIPQLGPAEKTIADVSLLPADLLARGAQPAAAPRAPAAVAPRREARASTPATAAASAPATAPAPVGATPAATTPTGDTSGQ